MLGHKPAATRYEEIAVNTASPLQLVVMLYDGAIHSLQEAQIHLRHKNIASRSRCVNRALAILSELQACLNFQEGGSIAVSLDRLYSYMKQRIFTANLNQESEPLAEVASLLGNLRSAWQEVARQMPAATEAPQAEPGFDNAAVLTGGTAMVAEISSLNTSG